MKARTFNLDGVNIALFESKLGAPTDRGCIEWQAARALGYGVFTIGKKPHQRMVKAHRVAWTLSHGVIPEGMFVCGHDQRGEKHNMVRLTETDVTDIRARVARGETQRSVSRIYKVSFSMISRIILRQAWAHVAQKDA